MLKERVEKVLFQSKDGFESETDIEMSLLEERVTEIHMGLIDPFENHPFAIRMDESMMELIESVRNHGVLVPCLVRPKMKGRYEMVAGHRRGQASLEAENHNIPCIIRHLTNEEATIIMVDSNLQREIILPSERAFAYKMRLEAMNRQGHRSDLTLTPMVSKLTPTPMVSKFRSNETLGDIVGQSREQIRRYIRLTELNSLLLGMVDEKKMGFRPAVEISYLSQQLQKSLLDIMAYTDATPSYAQALKMKKFYQEDRLSSDVMTSIMEEEKSNQQERIVLNSSKVSKLIPASLPKAKTEEYIIQALEYYKRYRDRSQDSR